MPRFSCTYKIAGTKTFRLGSSAIMDTWGGNAQNFEKSLRRIFTADKGKVLVQTDQSGAEALIVAYLLRPGNKLRELFTNNIKPHTYLGLTFPSQWREKYPFVDDLAKVKIPDLKDIKEWGILKKAIADSDNNPAATRYYYHYKQTTHSCNYGIGPSTFRLNILTKSGGKVALTSEQASLYVGGYNTLIPELMEWHGEIRNQLYETNYLFNLFGYPFFFNTINDSMFKEAYAIIPQSTVGVITHKAYCSMQTHIEKEKLPWDLLGNTHDSFFLQCPDDSEHIKHCATKSQEFMNQELVSPRGEKFRMKSETAMGFNWSPFDEQHPEKNPLGLKSYKL